MENNNLDEEYVEIDLREYIMVLIDRWKLITAILVVSILAASVYAFVVAEPIYEVDAKIHLGSNSGNYSKPSFAKEVFKSSSYWRKANNRTDLNLSFAELNRLLTNDFKVNYKQVNKRVDLNLEQKDLARFIKNRVEFRWAEKIIDMNLKTNNPAKAKKALEKLILIYKEESHQEFKEQLKQKKESIFELKKELTNLKKEIKQRQNSYQDLIKSDLSTTDKVILTNDFTNQLNKLKELRVKLIKDKNALAEEINDMSKLKVINPPLASSQPIEPNKRLILAIAGVLGLMLGVFAAFGAEFWSDFDREEYR